MGGVESGQTRDVFRFAEPAERDILQQLLELHRIIQEFCVDGRFDGPGGDGVNRDFAGGEFDGQISRQHLDSAFACAIGGKMRERKFLVVGGDIDYFSGSVCLPEVTHYRLRHKKHALQVDVENGVEIRFGHVPKVRAFLDAGVVDENIDLAEARDGLFDESLAVGNASDIRLKSSSASLHLCYSFYYFVRAFFVLAITDRNVGAIACETLRDRASDSLIAAGYGRYFALQSIGNHNALLTLLFPAERNPGQTLLTVSSLASALPGSG